MTRVRAVGAVVLLAVVLTWSILRLIRVQFSAGGFYPDYSSLRADPRGTKLLFDSLSRLSGLRVARNYMPLDYFNGNRAAVLLLGLRLEELNPALLEQVEKLARQGNRVVMALLFEESSRSAERGPIEHA